VTIFNTFSAGLQTNRDAWVYNSSKATLESNVRRLIDNYTAQHEPFAPHCRSHGITKPTEKDVTAYLRQAPEAADPRNIKWSRSLRQHLARSRSIRFEDEHLTIGLYRPFFKQHAYFDRYLNHERGQTPSMFPTPHHTNIGFYILGLGATKDFSVLMTRDLPDLNFYGSEGGQFFPRWTYEKAEAPEGQLDLSGASGNVDEWGYRRVDNITDEICDLYTRKIGEVSKDEIFYYVYGILHDTDYREEFAADLKKMLPHIPTPETKRDFDRYVAVGRSLA